MRQAGNKYFKEHEVLFILVQLCLALQHIHSKKMMHRDLKTANVLLTSSGIVKIGDFGFSRQYEDSLSKDVGTTFCGTPYYLSPELWKELVAAGAPSTSTTFSLTVQATARAGALNLVCASGSTNLNAPGYHSVPPPPAFVGAPIPSPFDPPPRSY